MILNPSPTPVNQFNYNPLTKTFSACISDLGPDFEKRGYEQVYDDACDVGLTLVNNKSGDRCVFVLNDTYKDDDGVGFWDFVPAGSRQKNTNLKLRIFND